MVMLMPDRTPFNELNVLENIHSTHVHASCNCIWVLRTPDDIYVAQIHVKLFVYCCQ